MARIDAFLKLGLAQGCSDVHLAVGVPPMLRMNGDLMPIKFRELTDIELETYIREILTANQQERLEAGHDLDFSYVSEDGGRFRVNVFRHLNGIGAIFRAIPSQALTLADLIGNDVMLAVADSLHEEYGEPRYATPPLLKRMVEAGIDQVRVTSG